MAKPGHWVAGLLVGTVVSLPIGVELTNLASVGVPQYWMADRCDLLYQLGSRSVSQTDHVVVRGCRWRVTVHVADFVALQNAAGYPSLPIVSTMDPTGIHLDRLLGAEWPAGQPTHVTLQHGGAQFSGPWARRADVFRRAAQHAEQQLAGDAGRGWLSWSALLGGLLGLVLLSFAPSFPDDWGGDHM